MVAGHLQEKKGLYYIVLNFTDENGKRKPKWIATGLPVKGNKRKAEALLRAEQQKYESGEVKSQLGAEMLFADYMLYWLKSIKGDVDVTTYSGYEGNVKKGSNPSSAARESRWRVFGPVTFRSFISTAGRTIALGTTRSFTITPTSAKR